MNVLRLPRSWRSVYLKPWRWHGPYKFKWKRLDFSDISCILVAKTAIWSLIMQEIFRARSFSWRFFPKVFCKKIVYINFMQGRLRHKKFHRILRNFWLFHRTIVNGWFCTTNAHRIMSKLKQVVQMGVIWDKTSQKNQKISLFYKNKCIFNKISTWLLNTIFFMPKIANFSKRTLQLP